LIYRLFLTSVTAADGWKRLLRSSELRLLFSLLLCKAALPEINPQTTSELNLQTTSELNLQTTSELNLQTTSEENPLTTSDENLQKSENLLLLHEDEDSLRELTKNEIKDEAGPMADEVEEDREIIADDSLEGQSDTHAEAVRKINSNPGPNVMSVKPTRRVLKRVSRHTSGKKKIKVKDGELELVCFCCGKQFVRSKGLARHLASHVFERDDSMPGTLVRCLFESCDFERKADSGSGLGAELREHELVHSCPICRTVCRTLDQMR